ncbi:hypothetical protein VKT23_012667 [Stygiomarasmius scandens]|uniref:Uncharacterized protein n=1 Tax=Marasmiellus scandens TaxID=2682957 RepID=A0ABR1J5D1_9AGAR
MPFTVTHDIFHLLSFVPDINLADPLWQSPPEVYDWFHYIEPREAALLVLVSEADTDVFEAPRCRERRDVWHQVEITVDIDTDEVGSLKRLDEYEHGCNCPMVLFRLDNDHFRCIRRAMTDLDTRYAREYSPEDLPVPFAQPPDTDSSYSKGALIAPIPTTLPPTKSSKKRAREFVDDEELPAKKVKRSRSVVRMKEGQAGHSRKF